MDIGTIAGLIIAFAAILISVVVSGGSITGLINGPSIFVVLVGTFGATVVSFPLARLLKLHTVILKSIFSKPGDAVATIKDLVRYAEVARREGILSLENLISEMRDPFIVRGVKMAVDGTDPELIKTIMDTELEALMERARWATSFRPVMLRRCSSRPSSSRASWRFSPATTHASSRASS